MGATIKQYRSIDVKVGQSTAGWLLLGSTGHLHKIRHRAVTPLKTRLRGVESKPSS
jgi:hypothetical protein